MTEVHQHLIMHVSIILKATDTHSKHISHFERKFDALLKGRKECPKKLKDNRYHEKRVIHMILRLVLRRNYQVKKSARLKNEQICFKVESTAKPNESTARL